MNPLKQHFRRPALSLKLPSGGKHYPEGSLDLPENGEVPVFPMTAIDEITSKTPDALYNGTAIVDIIKSCVPSIKNPWCVPSVDLDAILVAIKTASSGNDLDIESTCPSCNDTSKYGINLAQLLNNLKPENFDQEISVGDLRFKFKPLSYNEINKGNILQFEFQKEIGRIMSIENDDEQSKLSSVALKKLNEANISILADSIECVFLPDQIVIEKEYIIDYLNNCDKKTHDIIKNHILKLKESTRSKPLKVRCISCNFEYEQAIALNVTDFFV